MPVTVRDLRRFFGKHGAKMAFDGHGPFETVIDSPQHYETARRGQISWLRHEPLDLFGGSVLLMRDLKEFPTNGLESDQLLIAHPNMRPLVAEMLRKFFADLQGVHHTARSATVHRFVEVIDGQNYEWTGDRWCPFPAVGAISIGPGTEIGAFATIARGTMGNTWIGEGCRIGQHVNIGHDCRIGDHTIIIAGASLAGWVRAGERVKIYQGALVKNGVSIGDDAVIGMGAVVTKDVPAGETWVGNPARRVAPDSPEKLP